MSLDEPDDAGLERSISVAVSLDDDGFLRRECPHCESEFKWLPSDGSEPTPEQGYHCPYCHRQADTDQFFTKPQAEYLAAVGMHEFAGPLLDEFEQRIRGMGGGMLKVDVERNELPAAVQPDEPNDMRRVDFACHPKEPVKVLDDWAEPVHCLVCGRAAGAT